MRTVLLLILIPTICHAWGVVRNAWRRRQCFHFPSDETDHSIHEFFMQQALEQARGAQQRGEVPIGAVVVHNRTASSLRESLVTDKCLENNSTARNEFEVLATGANMVETQHDASAHAELVALRRAASKQGNWRLLDCTLYSTLEPCPMCLSACQAFRVDAIVYGAPDLRLGAVETHMQLLQIVQHPFHNVSTVISGVQEELSAEMLREFFRARRKQKTATPMKRRAWWKLSRRR